MILPAQFLLFLRSIQDLTLQEAGGWQKLRFWYILVIQLTRQKFDFSQIAMTMPPILFRGLKWPKNGFL